MQFFWSLGVIFIGFEGDFMGLRFFLGDFEEMFF